MSGFRLPDLGEGLQDAEIITWHVGPGDHVVADQPLVAVETDKAVVEIPSPWSGYIERLYVDEGDIVCVDDLLVEFTDDPVADVGAIVGDLRRSEPPVAARAIRATPAVRAEASRLGVDLANVAGTGPNGTVTGTDVEAASAALPATASDARAAVEPLRGARRSMAANMARAHASVVPATVTDLADVGPWAARNTAIARLIRAIAVACRAEPSLNVSFLGPDVGRSTNASVDLGIAMDSEDGLFVPVLRDVGNRTPVDLLAELESLKVRVVARTLAPEQLRGPTITLSNFGSIGGHHGVLVVVPPQVAIVGAGEIHDAVLARDGKPVVRPVLPLSLSFDHRAVTGGEAARFLKSLVADLELPS